ncbi:MAG TPA: hypothetical protein VJ692_00680 [Nitrospiraceae bacterium]|nr:hypothetical protein [Nitrospiraceae bacterium]
MMARTFMQAGKIGSHSNQTASLLRYLWGLVIGAAWLGCLCSEPSFALATMGTLPDHSAAGEGPTRTALVSPTETQHQNAPLTTQEFRYHMPRAGEVFLVWGVNGWQPTSEDIRPSGTVITNGVMHSPMLHGEGTFVVKVPAPVGGIVDYGFLITKLRSGAETQIWDGAERYHLTAVESGTIDITSAMTLDLFGNPLDRRGLLLVAILTFGFMSLIVLGIRLLLRNLRQNTDTVIPEQNPVTPSENVRFAGTVTLLFFCLGAITLWHHEMWRDELQAWRIAASSSSLPDLFWTLRYEGHPALWYLALYALSRIWDDPAAMQGFHLMSATAGVYLVSRFAPFTRPQKLCFAFGYFPLYEYGVISRSYVIGAVGVFAFCVAYRHINNRKIGPALVPALLLGLVANTSIYGAMIALVFGMAAVFDLLMRPHGESYASRNAVLALYVLIIGLSIAVSVMQMLPPPDSSPQVLRWYTSLDIKKLELTLSQVWRSYVPIPQLVVPFWDTNMLDGEWHKDIGRWQMSSLDVQAALSIILIGGAAWMLARTPLIMLVYVLTSAELLLFTQTKYYGGVRHAGHLFLVFVACIWMSRSRASTSRTAPPHAPPFVPGPTISRHIITWLFVLHMVAGLVAVRGDLLFAFSASQEVGVFLKDHHLADLPMIGSKHYIASAVALYLNRPMLYAESDRVGTYIIWKSGRHAVPPAQLAQKAEELASQRRRDVLLILSYDLGPSAAAEGLLHIGSFNHNIISDERYVLYLKCSSPTNTPVLLPNTIENALRPPPAPRSLCGSSSDGIKTP